MLELREMRNSPSLLSLPGPLRPGVVEPDRDLLVEIHEVYSIAWATGQYIFKRVSKSDQKQQSYENL